MRALSQHGAYFEADEESLTIRWMSAASLLLRPEEEVPRPDPPSPGDGVRISKGLHAGALGKLESEEAGRAVVALRLRSGDVRIIVPSGHVEAQAPPPDWFPRGVPAPEYPSGPVQQSQPRMGGQSRAGKTPVEEALFSLVKWGTSSAWQVARRGWRSPEIARRALESLVADGRAERTGENYKVRPRDPEGAK